VSVAAAPPPVAAWRIAVAVAVAHGVNDTYSAFLHPLLPRIMADLGLSITLAATLTMALGLAASLLQPVMGAAADRYGVRRFVIAGPLVSALFLSLIGFAGSFAVLLVLLALGGLGSALFHPPAAAMAASARAGGRAGARMSLFSFGGALGYALGPLAAVLLVGAFGMRGLALGILPALLLVPLLLRVLPAEPPPAAVNGGGFVAVARSLRGPLGVLFAISAIAAFVQRVFLTMQPIAIAADGGSEALGAGVLSVYLGAQAVGSIAGGLLTDRYDRRHVLFWLLLCSVPSHLLALALPPAGAPALVATAVAGLLNMALLAPLVVMAQEASPHGAATSAGIIMGLAWAAGSVGMIGAGALGDVIGARPAALLSMPVLLAAAGASLHPALRPYRTAGAARYG
jgi:FSR family fosmidomycin resistance protein-like MFS transporter